MKKNIIIHDIKEYFYYIVEEFNSKNNLICSFYYNLKNVDKIYFLKKKMKIVQDVLNIFYIFQLSSSAIKKKNLLFINLLQI